MARIIPSRHWVSRVLPLVALGLAPASGEAASSDCNNPKVVKRSIIALFDATTHPDTRLTEIHRHFELPANHLGYRILFRDVHGLGEDSGVPESTAAIMSWFNEGVSSRDTITRWRAEASTPCGFAPKQIVLGALDGQVATDDEAASLLGKLGLARVGSEVPSGHLTVVDEIAPDVVGFETDFLPGIGAYPNIRAAGAGRSFLSVLPTGGGESVDLVVIGSEGAYAHVDALLSDDPRLGAPLWILNPFEFLERTLGTMPRPIANTTTRNGLRVFFSTVKSDGWLDLEPSRYFGETVGIGGELLFRELVVPYPQLPTSVAVATGDFDRSLAGPTADRGRAAATEVFSQPQVAASTNGHDLVFSWAGIGMAQDPQAREGENRPGVAVAARALGELLALVQPSETTGAARKYGSSPFSLSSEISGALMETGTLASADGPARIFIWARGSMPPEEALRAAREAGAIAFGGGPEPSRPALPSLSTLSPQSAKVGSELQVYDALGSDASYTDFWLGDLAGFHGLRRTLEWTENPRRLKPFHLAYSARSALYFATRSAVAGHLEIARDGKYHPLSLSDYVRSVEGFESVMFVNEEDLSWRVLDRKGLQTVRFDNARELALDMERSTGVLGAVRKTASLYISLDPASNDPLVALLPDRSTAGVRLGAAGFSIVESNLEVAQFTQDRCTARLRAGGANAGRIAVLTRAGVRIDVQIGESTQTRVADRQGGFSVDVPGGGPFDISFSRAPCEEG